MFEEHPYSVVYPWPDPQVLWSGDITLNYNAEAGVMAPGMDQMDQMDGLISGGFLKWRYPNKMDGVDPLIP